MRIRTLFVSAGLLILCGSAHSQPQPAGKIPPQSIPLPPPPLPAAPPVSQEKSVDELIAGLEGLRAQKAALEKQEQELTAALRKKLQMQTERLQKLGVVPKPPEPDRIGRIIIVGNAEKDEKKILDAIGMRPGEALQYPALEEVRVKLKKAGFPTATVEVVPGEPDSNFKDIRVKVGEPELLVPPVPAARG